MVKLGDSNPNGPERRANGKLKLTAGDYLKIIGATASLLVAGTLGYFTLKWTNEANAQDIAYASTEIKEIYKVNQQQNDDIITIQADVVYIKDDVADIKIAQQSHTKLLYEIKGMLKKND